MTVDVKVLWVMSLFLAGRLDGIARWLRRLPRNLVIAGKWVHISMTLHELGVPYDVVPTSACVQHYQTSVHATLHYCTKSLWWCRTGEFTASVAGSTCNDSANTHLQRTTEKFSGWRMLTVEPP